ncbi:hypothetical protein J437_LFUL008588 [Ladona fulva]|uniref:Uncharacterized protein n=1 Tax=Ladona fulva TaxID=123851 RepID=A0A8K0P159_LADFU|nr:hypothetical protein J437_LFUL008588 [Ladona fulva]
MEISTTRNPLFEVQRPSVRRSYTPAVLRTGVNLLGDVVQNRPIPESVLRHVDEASDNLKRKAVDSIGKLMKGSGYKKPRVVNRRHSSAESQRRKKPKKRKKVKSKRKVKRISSKNGKTIRKKVRRQSVKRDECAKSELDLFTIPPTQTSIRNSQWVHYKPLSSINDDSPLEFVVSGAGDEYIDLRHTLIHVVAKIVKTDGADTAEEQKVGPEPYEGPCEVIKPGQKFFRLRLRGRETTVSIDRLKPAHLLDDDLTATGGQHIQSGRPTSQPLSHSETNDPQPPPPRATRSGRRVHFPVNLREYITN